MGNLGWGNRWRVLAVGMATVAVMAGGCGGERPDPAEYPACAELAQNPGTYEKALCADDEDVIEYEDWFLRG